MYSDYYINNSVNLNMGQGQDKIARSLLDFQPTAILEFFRIYPDTINKPTTYIPIHNGSVFENNLYWQNIQYIPVPFESEGFEINGNGQLARPKIRIANKDYLITSLLQNNKDFKNAKFVRKRTFLKYIDDLNFDGGNPFGSQDYTAEISNEEYLIGQKTTENKYYVEFELTSPLDLENFEVNHRKILAKYCYWQYRGQGCNYKGLPIEREDGTPFVNSAGTNIAPENVPLNGLDSNPNYAWSPTKTYNQGNIAYLENPKVILSAELETNLRPTTMKNWYVCVKNSTKGEHPESNPTYWQKDGCTKKISACKLRFNNAQAVKYTTFQSSKTEDFIRFSGDAANSKIGMLYSNDDNLLETFDSNFTLAGWVKDFNSINGAGVVGTTLSPTQEDKNTNNYPDGNLASTANRFLDNIESFNLNTWDKDATKDDLNLHYKIDDQTATNSKLIPNYSIKNEFAGTVDFNSDVHVLITAKRNLSSPHNYLRNSENFTANTWTKNNCTVTDDITGELMQPTNGLKSSSIENKDDFNIDSYIKADFSLSSSWQANAVATNFSIHVKKPDSNSYRFFYIKSREYLPGTPEKYLDRFSIYDLNATGIFNHTQTDYYFPEIKKIENDWFRVKHTVNNSNQAGRCLVKVDFGPLPGVTSPIYTTGKISSDPYNINQSIVFDISGDYGDGSSGIYISGAQLENGIYTKKYNKTTSIGYKHPNFDLNGTDSFQIEINNTVQHSFTSSNKNQLLSFRPEALILGNSFHMPNKTLRSLNGRVASWALWGRQLITSEKQALIKTIGAVKYPSQYEECLQSTPNIINNSLIAWWDMQIDAENSSQIIDTHQDLYPLQISGIFGKETITYTQNETVSRTKTVNNSSLHFGGFPGTDGFSYG
jgi:lambda family phage minor tail protein L